MIPVVVVSYGFWTELNGGVGGTNGSGDLAASILTTQRQSAPMQSWGYLRRREASSYFIG